MRMSTRMNRTNSRSTSPQSLARASSLALGFLVALAGCASGPALVPGQSTLQDVEARFGRPAETQPAPNGQTICWFPQLPWGHASYAARIGPDGPVIAVE